jgi:hypothetical protein
MKDTIETPEPQTAAGRYEELVTERDAVLRRAREAAALTIPALVPPEGSSSTTDLPTPFQAVGAEGVNNLTAKILLALLPPGSSFFKLDVPEDVLDQIKEIAGGDAGDILGEIQASLAKMERSVIKKMEASNIRPVLHETISHLIVAGNALLIILPNSRTKMLPISQYVVARDLEGNALLIIAKESLARKSLPPLARAIVAEQEQKSPSTNPQKDIDLYTVLERQDNGSWKVHQEIAGERIPGTEGNYPKDKAAFLPLRWKAVPGEAYGRGYVEEYIGDLHSLESLSQSLIDAAAACAKILFLVDPGSITTTKEIAEAPNLAVREGTAKDVTVLQVEKFADLSVAQKQADIIEKRLERAFLLTSSIQRNAERVTAEEIRLMAAELEQGLGGIYSVLSQELQHPLVVRIMHQMTQAKELPHLPQKEVQPTIITGLEGLGRTSDLMRLDALLTGTAQMFGPEAISEYVNAGAYITRRAAALSIDISGLVRSEEEVQAARQQQMQAALAEKLGPTAIKANADRDMAAQQQAAEQEQAA